MATRNIPTAEFNYWWKTPTMACGFCSLEAWNRWSLELLVENTNNGSEHQQWPWSLLS